MVATAGDLVLFPSPSPRSAPFTYFILLFCVVHLFYPSFLYIGRIFISASEDVFF